MVTLIKWIIGLGCFIIGFMAFSISIIGGFLLFIAGQFFIPPIYKSLNLKLSPSLRIAIPVFLIVAGLAFVFKSLPN